MGKVHEFFAKPAVFEFSNTYQAIKAKIQIIIEKGKKLRKL
jgi:hypothetical protein